MAEETFSIDENIATDDGINPYPLWDDARHGRSVARVVEAGLGGRETWWVTKWDEV
jgi:hypothetical protein